MVLKTGIALRPAVIAPNEIVKLAKVIDQSSVSHLFIPDIPGSFDSLEVSSACLGVTKGLRVGSGVFRLLEHDERQLLRRLETLQAISANRYLLGVGTGNPGPKPEQKIDDMVKRLQEIRIEFPSSDGISFPESYIATLKVGIAKKVAGSCDGILMNFCSPGYAAGVVKGVRESHSGNLEMACYLKTFFSKSKETATKLAIDEFDNYNMLGHYHKMFEKDGVSDLIRTAKSSQIYPDRLREISPINPEQRELAEYVTRFREAGVTIPCVYPYFAPGETFEFKLETIRTIISSAE
jgi:luciferase-like monooxygenase